MSCHLPPIAALKAMLGRIVARSLTRQRRRKLLSLGAVALGMTVATTVTTIALDVGDRVNRELRSFGANIRVTPAADGLTVAVGGMDYRPAGAGAFLAEDSLPKLKKVFWRNNILAFVPYLSTPATVQGRHVMLTGTWFEKNIQVDRSELFSTGLVKMHPDWRVRGQWPKLDDESGCLVGRRVAEAFKIEPGQTLKIEEVSPPLIPPFWSVAAATVRPGSGRRADADRLGTERSGAPDTTADVTRAVTVTVRGILETGGPEDEQIFARLDTVQKLTGLEDRIRWVEVSALTKPEDNFARADITKMTAEQYDRWYCTPYVRSIATQIQQVLPGSEAKPVFQVTETEGRILNRVGALMALLGVAALVAAGLAVSSMMLATIFERRAEIGLFKSLGATDARVATIFLLEALAIGLVGGLAGYAAGSLLARRLTVTLFGLPTEAHWIIFPGAVALALIVTLTGSALPLLRGLRVSAAVVLRD
jgi:putative ABC transport system permease protein